MEAAVLETGRHGGILRAGLGFDLCDVAVLTNIGDGDHLGLSDIHTPEQLAWVKSTLVASVSPQGYAVLNAADPLGASAAAYCRGSIIYFALDGGHPIIVEHRAAGGRAAFVRDEQIILAEGKDEFALISILNVPLTHGGRVGFQIENVLAAVGAAWALKIPMKSIRSGLETFMGGLSQTPGRFNLLEIRGATVILDYGHNVSALNSLIQTLDQFPHTKRSIVYSAAGDRRDEDMIRQGAILGEAFDTVLIYEDTYLRGRREGEISELFRKGLAAGSRVKEIIDVRGGLKAVEEAFSLVRPGELLVLQPDIIEDTIGYLQQICSTDVAGREIDFDTAVVVPALVPEVRTSPELLEVRTGRLGKSVHVTESVRKGQVLLRCWGAKSPERTRHTIQVDTDTHILAAAPLLFLNHSCEPNCGLLIRRGVKELELHALKLIEAGEELTLDYATFESEIHFMTEPCQCHTRSCRGNITGYDAMPTAVSEAYGIYIAEHLREAGVLACK